MKSALRLGLVALAWSLGGCAGYHLGETKPGVLKDVHTIAVGTFRNETFHPRVEGLITNTVIKQLQQDGTFQITSEEKADAILEGTVSGVTRAPARSLRGNVLATREFNVVLTVSYKLRRRGGGTLLGPALITGTTSFFVGSDVVTDERQALPLATEDLAVRLVSRLSEGW